MKTTTLKGSIGTPVRLLKTRGYLLGILCASLLTSNVQAQKSEAVTSSSIWAKGGTFEGFKPEQEAIEKRTRFSKHFRNANGSYTLQSGDIYHYKDDHGAWQDIDLTIVPQVGGFASSKNDVKTKFPATAANGGVVMTVNDQVQFSWWNNPKISYSINGTTRTVAAGNITGAASGNSLVYSNAYSGISEEFVTLKTGVENNTIIHSLNSDLTSLPANSMVSFTQTIPLKQGWNVDVAGTVITGDFTAEDFHIAIPGTEQGIFFSPVVVFDHSLTRNEAMYVTYAPQEKLTAAEKLQKLNNVYKSTYAVHFTQGNIEVTSRVPASWLQSSSRSFPVTVDPSVTVTPPSSAGTFYGPTTNWYGFQRHANLYLASELGISNVNITDIEYNRTDLSGTIAAVPLKVFMRNTTATTLTADTWNSASYTGGLTPNFDATIDIFGTTTGWKTITLTGLFNYTTDNLMVMVYDAYASSGSAKYINQGSTSVTGRQAYKRQDGTDPGDASALLIEARLPEIRITYVPAAPPACVTTSLFPVDGNTLCVGSTTLRWNKKERATGYDVYLNTGTGTPTTVVSTNQADTFYTFTSTANNYVWKAIPKNATGPATGCGSFSFKAMTNITPDVTITRTPSADTLCPSDSVVFTATPVNGGLVPVFQWKKNGANVGTNSPVYTDNTLTAADNISVTLSTSITGSCLTKSMDTSNVMNIKYRPAPDATVTSSGSTSFCLGGNIRLNVPSGAASYQWRNNGTNLGSATTSSYQVFYSGVYTAKVTGANGCATISDPIVVNSYAAPTPMITRLGNTASTDPYYVTYQWYYNNTLIPGATSSSYTFSHDGSYKVVVTDTIGCGGASAVLPVNELSIGNAPGVEEINIFPNPTAGIVNVKSAVTVNIIIRSIEGKEVLRKSASNSIDVSSLANGIYMLYVTDKANNTLKIEKLVKNGN